MEVVNLTVNKKPYVVVIIIILVLFSWVGSLDKYSDNYTNKAIVQAGSSYAVARGINAIVSVMQTTTLTVSLGAGGSIMIGEVLDPVNDLIERFSQVMTVALSSLVMQKILLGIAANKIFSSVLTLFGVISFFGLMQKDSAKYLFAFKFFMILVIIRFSLGFVVLGNSTVDHMFLSTQIERNSATLGEFKDTLNEVQLGSNLSEKDASGVKNKIKQNRDHLKRIQDTLLPNTKGQLREVESKLEKLKADLGDIKEGLGLLVILNPFNDNKRLILADLEIEGVKVEKEKLGETIEDYESEIERLQGANKSLSEELTGDSDGFIARIENIKKNLSFESVETKVSEFIDNVFKLLVLFVMQAILIPLAFFYLLTKLIRAAWKANWKLVFPD